MPELEEKVQKVEDRQDKVEIKMAEIGKDIQHIKERIDNGISATVSKIWENLNSLHLCITEKFTPLKKEVAENTSWRKSLQRALLWLMVVSLGGGFLTVTVLFVVKKLIQ